MTTVFHPVQHSKTPSLLKIQKLAGHGDVHHQAKHVFVLLIEMVFHHIAQAGFKHVDSSDLSASASQSAQITGMSHGIWPNF